MGKRTQHIYYTRQRDKCHRRATRPHHTYTGRLLRRSLTRDSTTRGSATSAHRSFLWAACVAVAQIQRDTALGAARLALLFDLVVRQPVIAIPTDIAMFLIAGHAPHVAWTQLEPPRGARCTRRTPIFNLFDNDYATARIQTHAHMGTWTWRDSDEPNREWAKHPASAGHSDA